MVQYKVQHQQNCVSLDETASQENRIPIFGSMKKAFTPSAAGENEGFFIYAESIR